MKRKVIQLSTKTLVISLPLDWAEKNKVIKGSEVEVIEKDDRLLITTQPTESLKIILNLTDKTVFDKRYIGDLYIRGYDEIKIKFQNPTILEEIRKIDLLGYDIVETGKDYCIIKNVASALEAEFDTMLRKCFMLTKQMFSSLVDHFEGNDVNLKEVRKLEAENNKISVFCLRILNKHGYKESHKTTFLYVIAREIEAICDILKYIIDDLAEGAKVNDKTKKYCALLKFKILFVKKTIYITILCFN